jgi:transcriptional regulator with XRE-family HTH domain
MARPRTPRLSELEGEPVSIFGMKVKALLARYGWSQAMLARLLGVRSQSVSLAMRSKVSAPETVERYASALNVKPESLDPGYSRRKVVQLQRERQIVRRRELLQKKTAKFTIKGDDDGNG